MLTALLLLPLAWNFAAFGRPDAEALCMRYLPPPMNEHGIVHTANVKRIVAVHRVLRDDTAFVVLGDDGVATSAFVFTRPEDPHVHRLDACIVSEEEPGEALEALEAWHAAHFRGVELVMG